MFGSVRLTIEACTLDPYRRTDRCLYAHLSEDTSLPLRDGLCPVLLCENCLRSRFVDN
jgi:hypothetical protein